MHLFRAWVGVKPWLLHHAFCQGQPCWQDPQGLGFHSENLWVPYTALLLPSQREVLPRGSLNPFLPSYRKRLKTPECWIVPFYMMAEQQPNLMSCRVISKRTVAWRGWNSYCTDTPLHHLLTTLPTYLSCCREEAAVLSTYREIQRVPKHLAASAGCGAWEPEMKGILEPETRQAQTPGKMPQICFPSENVQIKDAQ